MDYEKAYREAVEAVKKLKEANPTDEGIQNWVNDNFPNLQEPEDEQIKKALVSIFEAHPLIGYDVTNADILAWLEKQGEQKPTDKVEPKFNVGDWIIKNDGKDCFSDGSYVLQITDINGLGYKLSNGCYLIEPVTDTYRLWKSGYEWDAEKKELKKDEIKIKAGRNYRCIKTHIYAGLDWLEGTKYYADEDYSLVNNGCTCFCPKYSKHEHNNLFEEVECDGYVEKQSEQKPADKVDALMSLDEAIEHCKKRSCGNNACALEHKQLEKWLTELKELQEQQKPVETIEPKFKVGDWVINTITKEVEQILELTGNEYLCSGYLIVSYKEQHLLKSWTIQDAKDGDVLATKKGNPFIYDKNRYNNGLAYYYAGLDVNKELTLKSPHHMLGHFGELCSVFPATEEQSDLLFSKMHDAGYEWDSEKKELRKIKQTFVEWNVIKDVGYIDDLIAHFSQNEKLENTKEDIIDWLKSLKNRNTSQLNWNEEDVNKKELKKIDQEPLIEGSFVNVDEVREDFMQEVYRVLDADPTNDRANQIIDAFDNLPTVIIERKGEQKPNCSEEAMKYLKENHSPSEVSDFQAAMNIAVAKAYDKGKADAITEMQNYAWSEEDEKKLKTIINVIHGGTHLAYEKELNWLLSLKNRIQLYRDFLLQPKQEWSDEDEKFFKTALMHIGYSVSNGKSTDGHCETSDWLISIKERMKGE